MSERRVMTRWIAILAAAFVLVGGAAWHVGGPIRPLSSLHSIEGAMGDDVTRAIGPPTEIDEHGNWVYRKAVNPGWLTISFNEHGRVESVDHEYAFM